MSDTVSISDLMMYAQIGCTAEERAFPQRLLLSARFSLDLSRAGNSGKLDETICYATLSDDFARISARKDWVLLEQLCEALARHSLENYTHVSNVGITIKKFAVPNTEHVAVSIERSR